MYQHTDSQADNMLKEISVDFTAQFKDQFRAQFKVNEYEMGREWALSFMQQEEKRYLMRGDNLRQAAYCELLWDTFTEKL